MTIKYIDKNERYGEEYSFYSDFFRSMSLEVDANPNSILNYIGNPAVQFVLNDRRSTVYERTKYLEAFSHGDPGAVLACPGPSLSGLMIRELGTEKEAGDFHDYLSENSMRTFFALTEPGRGSDAGSLQCSLDYDKKQGLYLLNGEKCLFGNAADGRVGVVLARINNGPLGVRAVKITEDILDNKNFINRYRLKSFGLRGAQIGYMKFTNCPITPKNILGEHLNPMRRGMMAVIKTFNRLWTGVGALGLGQAQAVLDYVYINRSELSASSIDCLAELFIQLDSARKLIYWSAQIVDKNSELSCEISIAKAQATKVSEKVIVNCLEMLPLELIIHDEWLTKCLRDCFAWEFMEGTSTMQYKNVFNDFMKNGYQLKEIV